MMRKQGSMRYQAPSQLILIQCLTTEWTKRTRDAESAGKRNHLPEMLLLPANRPGVPGHVEHQTADIYYHHVHYDEWNDYQKPYRQFWIPLRSRLPESTLFSPYIDPRRAFVRRYHRWNNFEGADYEHWFLQQSRLPNARRLFEYGNPRIVVARTPIRLIREGKLLYVKFYPGKAPFSPPNWGGRPERPSDRPKKFPLLPGQWMQICFNGKSTIGERGWTYLKSVLNIGFVDVFTSSIFCDTPPKHRYSDIAHLW